MRKHKHTCNIYTDAGYSMKSRIGHLAYKNGGGKVHIKRAEIPNIPHLKQFNNLLEFQAILVALKTSKAKRVLIHTDSKIAFYWFKRNYNDLLTFSEYHHKIKDEIEKEKAKFMSCEVIWVPRGKNKAGIALEAYLGA